MPEENQEPPPGEKFCINGKPVRHMSMPEIEHHLKGVTVRVTNAQNLATVAVNDIRKLAGMHAILEYECECREKSGSVKSSIITDPDVLRKMAG